MLFFSLCCQSGGKEPNIFWKRSHYSRFIIAAVASNVWDCVPICGFCVCVKSAIYSKFMKELLKFIRIAILCCFVRKEILVLKSDYFLYYELSMGVLSVSRKTKIVDINIFLDDTYIQFKINAQKSKLKKINPYNQ